MRRKFLVLKYPLEELLVKERLRIRLFGVASHGPLFEWYAFISADLQERLSLISINMFHKFKTLLQDAFRYLRGDCSHWFLTHFHVDRKYNLYGLLPEFMLN